MDASDQAREQALLARYPRVAELLERGRQSLETDGTYPAKVFNDPEVYAVERERVFGKAWIYLGHATEIPHNGDYVLRYISDNQFVLIRGKDGVIRALHNSCRHRGVQVCRAEKGNAAAFQCPYHGWTYANTGKLVGVPTQSEAYGKSIDKAELGLRPVPQLGMVHDMIFGSLDPNAPALEDYLGPMKWYLELMANRSPGGLEVVGVPQRWIVEADWKIAADNFIGDSYHTLTTHRSMIELGLGPPDPKYAMHGQQIDASNGHGLGLTGSPPGLQFPPYFGLPTELAEAAVKRLTPQQAAVMKQSNFMHGTVFPNLSFLQVWVSKDHKSPPSPMITFRLWQPLGPGRMEVWSWFLVDRDGPGAYKDESYKAYLRTFGISGGFEQDDAEIWSSIARMTQGEFARSASFNYRLGRSTLSPDAAWPGPGIAYPMDYAEFAQRAFHSRWLQYMAGRV
jgi:phenylpropionate dioxygenase-like ring-hydroxylating dioxygenase large terminal subunit